MKLYITRHGETEWNKISKMQGWQNSDLTQKGIENAIKLSQRLKDIDISTIYTSPLGRALDTAKYIRGNRNIEIITCEELKEIKLGLWEGMENERIIDLYKEEHYNFWHKPHLYKPVGDGETLEELFNRVNRILKHIIKNTKGENVLIVTHGVTIKVIYSIIKGLKIEDLPSLPIIEGTSLNIVEVNGDEMKFILEADTSHFANCIEMY